MDRLDQIDELFSNEPVKPHTRLFAGIIDLIIWYGLFFALNQIFLGLYNWPTFILSLIILCFLYPLILIIGHTFWGNTIGEHLLSIKHIEKDGKRKLSLFKSLVYSAPLLLISLLDLGENLWFLYSYFDYLNDFITKGPEGSLGFLIFPEHSYIISTIAFCSPFLWVATEYITSLLNKDKLSIQDRYSNTRMVNSLEKKIINT